MSYKLLMGISPDIQLRCRSGQIWTDFSFQVKRSKVKVKVRPDKVKNTPDSLKPLLGIARNLQLQCSWGQRLTFWVLESCFLVFLCFCQQQATEAGIVFSGHLSGCPSVMCPLMPTSHDTISLFLHVVEGFYETCYKYSFCEWPWKVLRGQRSRSWSHQLIYDGRGTHFNGVASTLFE